MIDKICEVIAENSKFSQREVRLAYDLYHSIDLVLMGINFSVEVGLLNLSLAVDTMAKRSGKGVN